MTLTQSIVSGIAEELQNRVDRSIYVRINLDKCKNVEGECLTLWFNSAGRFSGCCKSNLGVIVYVRDGLAHVAFGLWDDDYGWEVADSYLGAVELTDLDLVDELAEILAGINIMRAKA